MSQYAEIIINYELLVKIIKKYLIQDENAQAPRIYEIEYRVGQYNTVYVSVSEEIMIGGVKGKVKEDLDDDTIGEMILNYIKADGYSYNELEYIIEKGEDNEKILSGVKVTLEPDIEDTFVKEL